MSTNPYAPPVAAVRDIPATYGTIELADLGPRLGAAFLDGIILCAMIYLPIGVGGALMAGVVSHAGDLEARRQAAVTMLLVALAFGLIGFGAWCWLTIKYVVANSQSIGKKIVGIKVVRSDGSPIGLGRLFWLRNVVNGLLGFIPLYGLIDILFIFGESRQCVHDKLADTIVVKA